MLSDNEMRKIEYLCHHRGLLEIELIFSKFFDNHKLDIINYSEDEKDLLMQILEIDDNFLLQQFNNTSYHIDEDIVDSHIFQQINEYYNFDNA